jgi:hypothetical protein
MNAALPMPDQLAESRPRPLIGATDIVPEHSITVLLGSCPVGAHDCDSNHEAHRTSNSNEHARRIIPQRRTNRPAAPQPGYADRRGTRKRSVDGPEASDLDRYFFMRASTDQKVGSGIDSRTGLRLHRTAASAADTMRLGRGAESPIAPGLGRRDGATFEAKRANRVKVAY